MKVKYPILAIDYGKKRIGLAVSDTKGIVATPLRYINVTAKNKTKGILTYLKIIIKEWNVKTILIGLPQAFEKSHKEIHKEIKEFGNLINDKTSLPVIYHDESYSTKKAEKIIQQNKKTIEKAKGKIDSIASAIFLQEFLNKTSS